MKLKYLNLLLLTSAFASCQEPLEQTISNDTILQDSTPVEAVLAIDTASYIYTWLDTIDYKQSLCNLIATPDGYSRIDVASNSYGDWLRHLPLSNDKTVYIFDGTKKYNQSAQHAVINIDVGKRDLQQCADAVMRLRAEYLYAYDGHDKIQFNYTNGVPISFSKWSSGYYPKLTGNRVNWVSSSNNKSYKSFKKYMTNIFMYAGTASLSKELKKVELENILPGDVFIWGGFPGHAVTVVDVAVNAETGDKCFLLAQSYMPAQNIHILKNPMNQDYSPWYSVSDINHEVLTPEWTFSRNALSRFEE